MRIVSLGDILHKISNTVVWENKKNMILLLADFADRVPAGKFVHESRIFWTKLFVQAKWNSKIMLSENVEGPDQPVFQCRVSLDLDCLINPCLA